MDLQKSYRDKKVLIVIGDSHMTPSSLPQYSGTHFSEIIAKELGYTLIPYSRGGMSNGGIAVALQTALTEEPVPNLILLGSTYQDRFEWPWGTKGCRTQLSIRDLRYFNPKSLSHKLPLAGDDPRLVSASLGDVIDQPTKLWQEGYTGHGDPVIQRLSALKTYFEFLYDANFKRFMDSHLVYSMYHRIHKSGIPFVVCRDVLDVVTTYKVDWLNEKTFAWPGVRKIVNNTYVDTNLDPGYHTTPEVQEKIARFILDNCLG